MQEAPVPEPPLMRRPLLLTALLAAGCDASVADGEVEPCSECVLSDANNYAYTSTLAVDTLAVPEHADTLLRWDGLTRDLRGDPLDPGAIAEARLVAFRSLTPEQIVYGLAHDALDQADVAAYVTCVPTDASCALSEFGMFGNAIDIQQYFEEGYGTWLLALGGEGVAGVDALAFLAPGADVTALEAVVTDTTSRLDADVDLASLAPVVVDPYTADITLDWSGLTRDGIGDPLELDTVDELWIGRFDQSPAELERRAFELEILAEASWTLDVNGATSAELALAQGDGAFLGIDRAHTWMAALRCRSCTNPAPRVLTFLEPVPQ